MSVLYELLTAADGASADDVATALAAFRHDAGDALTRHDVVPIGGGGPRGESTFPFDVVVEAFAERPHDLPAYAPAIDAARSFRFEVDETAIREGSAPLRLVILSKRNAAMDPDRFRAYLQGTHGPLTLATEDYARHLRGYRQSYIRPGTLRRLDGGEVPFERQFDGVVQFWFDDRDGMMAAYSSPGYRGIMNPDEEVFITRGYSLAFATA